MGIRAVFVAIFFLVFGMSVASAAEKTRSVIPSEVRKLLTSMNLAVPPAPSVPGRVDFVLEGRESKNFCSVLVELYFKKRAYDGAIVYDRLELYEGRSTAPYQSVPDWGVKMDSSAQITSLERETLLGSKIESSKGRLVIVRDDPSGKLEELMLVAHGGRMLGLLDERRICEKAVSEDQGLFWPARAEQANPPAYSLFWAANLASSFSRRLWRIFTSA